jgi:tetratricopeptide (TPR) repeat protein
MTYLREGNFEAAQQALNTALKINPKLAAVQYYLGLIAKSQGKYDQALVHLKKVVAKYTRDRVVRNERGHLYLLMQDYNRAILDFEKVLSMDPENLEAYYYLIRAYGVIGEKEKAKQAELLYNRLNAGVQPFQHAVSDTNALRERRPLHEHHSMALPSGAINLPAQDEEAKTVGQ